MQERLLEAEYKRSIAESSSSFWPSFILGDSLRIVFQNLLLESNEEIVQCSGRVWRIFLQVCCLYLSFPSKPPDQRSTFHSAIFNWINRNILWMAMIMHYRLNRYLIFESECTSRKGAFSKNIILWISYLVIGIERDTILC